MLRPQNGCIMAAYRLQSAHARKRALPNQAKPMTSQSRHNQLAEKVANIDLNKEPANDHEAMLQRLKRTLLQADWIDEERTEADAFPF